MRKRILSTLLALCLALSLLPASALAAGGEQKSYVALGDSITTGYGLAENETGFAKQVADSNGYTLTNLAQDGATSTDLLEVVKSEANADTLKNADLITVTIGGNDLMNALYAYLAEEYNNKQNSDTPITAADVKASLAGTLSEIPQVAMLSFAASKIPDFPDSTAANTALSTFATNFSSIISAIKGNNSSAEIIVVNQYNPYSRLSTGNLLDLSALDSAVQALNTAISSGATAGYTVADVYTAFEEATENPCNASVSLPSINLDFHPNAAGHSLIASTISALLTDEGGSEDPEVSGSIFVGGVELEGSSGTTAYATTTNGAVTKDNANENNYNIKWDGATLTLKGAEITTIAETPDYNLPQSAAICYDEATDLEIVLEGDNTVTGPDASSGGDSSSYGIHVDDEVTLTISGSGSLTATGGDAPAVYGGVSYGIYTWGNVIITGGDVTATGRAAEFQSHGIYATGHATISGGAVKATGGAVTSSEEDGGDASSGICADIVTISGGTVIAQGGAVTSSGNNTTSCGIYGSSLYGGVIISGGAVTATGTTANAESYGIYTPNSDIEISGGTVTATGDTGALGRAIYLDPEGNASIQSIQVKTGQDANSATEIIGSPFVLSRGITDLVSGDKYFHSESQTLEGDIFVGGVGLTGAADAPAYAKTGTNGAVTTEGANANDYNIKWDGSTLTLNNATITQGALGGAAIWYYRDSDLNIDLVGTNTVTGPSGSGSGASYGIFAYGPTELIGLTISGDGSLTVTGGGTVSGSFGICTGNLIVQSGSVNATGGDGAEDSYGIYANKNLTISGGTVNATGGDSGEDSYGISAYDVTISRGDVTATGGTVTATSEDGAEDSYGIYADYVTIYGGAVNATGRDSAEDSYGIYVDYVTINGGTVTAEGGTAEVKSAGIDIVTLVISGGTVTATGNTSGVYAVYDGKRITIDPQTDQQIEVLLGESETAAAAIEGSPFASETEITGLVNNTGKYFHSEVVGTTPPEPEEFTITFDAAGGTTPASQTTVDGKLTSLPTSTRDGYDFLGWYTAGGDWVTTDTVFTADTTLYARWAEQAGPGDDDKPPYIPPQPTGPNTGNSEGWDDIQEEINQAQPGDTITIDMNGETEVPAEMFEEVAGKDVTVELDLGGGITWTVNGQDVPTDTSLSDLDLGVDLGTNGISADVINTVTGAYGTVQMTLAHDGAFGFTLTLTAPLGRENAGYWANLYHYDEEAEALTFETSAQIADDGSVALRMSHASQYAIVIDDKNHGENAGQPTLNTQDHDAYLLGYEDGTVRPEGSITRAEVATIFFRLLTDESRDKFWSQTNDYTDVPADAWYNNAVSTLSNAGILDGYEDGTFRPDGNITRAEFATITARFLEASYDGGNRFPDIDGHWAAEYINEAANAGIVDGYEDGTFRPQQNITRAEAVTMVNRTVDRHPDADHLLDNMVTWPDNPESAWYYAQIQEATNAHAYTMHTDQEDAPYEIWTELLPNRDWSALEQAWSDAHAGGENATA
ncbi:S-layer homology domain-containing protein [Evtepia sp.]|uniref:S-layer homology domain-containing protein n=1 Tax=Evtepia sp. TaxID=2773933 RepID=UPI002E7A42A8|nr:S-layer homology domain-containing protein [Evtepia sp.]MEE0746964.1 S-layer homology domain-containing protein [Evtepia sp.]